MCDEEVMSLIAEKLGSDLIVIPSSIHETIILKETENVSVTELNAMVEAVNEEAVTPQEKLGNSVYRFDREAQRLEKAVEQAEKLDFEPGMLPVFSSDSVICFMSIVDVRRDAESTVLFHGLAERKHSAA